MQDTVTESEDRVPVLGAIPLLGNLFKSRSGSRQKSNLLVFLRPKILRDQPATEAVSDSKYNEIREEERTLHKGNIWLLPGEKQPSIPHIPHRTPTVRGRRRLRPRPRRAGAQYHRSGSPTGAERASRHLLRSRRHPARSPPLLRSRRRPARSPPLLRSRRRPARSPRPPRSPRPLRSRPSAHSRWPRHERRAPRVPAATQAVVSVRKTSRRPGARYRQRLRGYGVPPGRHAAGSGGGAPLRRRAVEARARLGRGLRFDAAHRV